ncbi:hypothetical protein [Paenarthrobacter ilicis]|uniref:hypothetical protein n=1 Tax=Paenarthrobacter ilicis TaxID=43665 RepID=UPI00195D0882|nr:hypothetical protein [Paenarthrobacter ilicis]
MIRQILSGLTGLGRVIATLVPAALLIVSYAIGATAEGGEALVGNVLLRSYIGGSQSQMVLLAVGALLVASLSSTKRVTPTSEKTLVSSPE